MVGLTVMPGCRDRVQASEGKPGPSEVKDISDLLDQERIQQKLPAVAAVVIQGDRIVARGVAGVRKRGRPEKTGLEDRWHLGSNGKAMTATRAALMALAKRFKATAAEGD